MFFNRACGCARVCVCVSATKIKSNPTNNKPPIYHSPITKQSTTFCNTDCFHRKVSTEIIILLLYCKFYLNRKSYLCRWICPVCLCKTVWTYRTAWPRPPRGCDVEGSELWWHEVWWAVEEKKRDVGVRTSDSYYKTNATMHYKHICRIATYVSGTPHTHN